MDGGRKRSPPGERPVVCFRGSPLRLRFLMIGQTLDHYRIESKLGEGGMGVVYKARDIHLDRLVAIKVLPADKVADTGRKHRFVQEAKAASALNHPNIITIYDIRSQDGTDFIVMEYVAGKTLDEVVPVNGMRPAQALKCAVQIADALAQAHGAGIVHRDLKPSNVMITAEGRIKVLDFGLAKLLEPENSSSEATTLTARPFTEEGTVVGTVPYMSPEQAEGRPLDARSDIFSFGAVLYQMTTGRRPFTGRSQLSILSSILKEDPTPPSQVGGGIPPELEKIILRCLRKDPARRYQTMADLKVALEDLSEGSATGMPVQSTPLRRRWIWSALLPMLLVGGFFAWRLLRTPEPPEPLRAVALTSFPGVELYPSLSPDGNYVAYTWTGPKQDNPDVWVQMIGSSSPLRLTTDPRGELNPVWSPDGRWIAFLRVQSSGLLPQVGTSELLLKPPLGGPERKLAEIRLLHPYVPAPWLAWCPDSRCLVVTDSPGEGKPDALFVVWLETGQKTPLTIPQAPVLSDSNPAISPDGRSLVFRREIAIDTGELYTLPLGKDVTAGGELKRLTVASLNAGQPTWTPDGKEILFSAKGSLWRKVVAGKNPGDSPPARLPYVGEDGLMPVVSHPQSGRPARLVYARSFSDWNIWRIDTSAPGVPASSPPVVAISSTRWDNIPEFSPDGRRVAFHSTRSGESEIWLADPDGSNAVQLTSMGQSMAPRWSSDGRLILFESNLEGRWGVYVVAAEGGKPRRLSAQSFNEGAGSFSRDRKWIYFSSDRTGEFQIWKMPASGEEKPIQVTRNGGWVALESPDGAYVYYTERQGTKPSPLWRLPTSGGEPTKVLDGVVMRAFVVLEKGIYYIDRPAAEARLQFFDFQTGLSRTVAGNLGDVRWGLTASSDGRTILYARADSSVDDLMLVENFR